MWDKPMDFSRRNLLGFGAVGLLSTAAPAWSAPVLSGGPRGGLPIIDVHSHTALAPWVSAMQQAGMMDANRRMPNGFVYPTWSAEASIAVMDKHHIATSVLSLPTAVSFAGQGAPALARAINEGHAEIKARYPGRFGAYAVLPSGDLDAAMTEMAYALDVLKLDGVATNTNIEGVYLGDARFDPWFAEMDQRGVALFVHPERPKQWADIGIHVSILEFMAESTRMITNMVLSGAKKRFANIKMISPHGGGTIPYLAQRISWLETQFGPGSERETLTSEEVIEGLASFYFDLTAATSAAQLDAMLHLVPHTQLMMGFDLPIMSEAWVDQAQDQLFGYSGLSSEQLQDICYGNAVRVFPNLGASLGA